MAIIGILAFAIALLVSVMIHEAGHYLTAKKFGMKVTEFFLGFGQKIWSFTRGETEFGLKAIPAGGYCRIVGMTPREELSPEDAPRAFVKASVAAEINCFGCWFISALCNWICTAICFVFLSWGYLIN